MNNKTTFLVYVNRYVTYEIEVYAEDPREAEDLVNDELDKPLKFMREYLGHETEDVLEVSGVKLCHCPSNFIPNEE